MKPYCEEPHQERVIARARTAAMAEKKGDMNSELAAGAQESESLISSATASVDDTPDALLLLANRLQKALDARSNRAPPKKSRDGKH